VNCAFVPWVFSCLPSDELQAPVLSGALSDAADGGGCALISVADHDSQSAAADLKRALARRGVPMRLHLQVRVGQPDLASVARQIVESGARVAAVMGDWRESARLVQALRKHGWKGPILAGCAAGRRHFLEAAGPAAEGVVFPWLLAESPRLDRFAGLYRQRFQRIPDYAAIQTYDAVHLVVQAVRAAGLNRARIRDALQKLAPWDGAAGPIVWDALGQNQRPVTLGVVRQGRAALYTTPEQ
jgi:branched-chain amino acid transport system substrate-binding protein